MKLRDKLLVILLAVLLLVMIPPYELITAWNAIAHSYLVKTYYPYFESVRSILVALVLFLTLGFLMVKKVIGSHRAFYAIFGAVLILVSNFYSNPFNMIESQVVSIFFVAGLELTFVAMVRYNQARFRYAVLVIPTLAFLFIASMFFVIFLGFAVFLGSVMLMRKTAMVSISDLNKKVPVKVSPAKKSLKKPVSASPPPSPKPSAVPPPKTAPAQAAPQTAPSAPQSKAATKIKPVKSKPEKKQPVPPPAPPPQYPRATVSQQTPPVAAPKPTNTAGTGAPPAAKISPVPQPNDSRSTGTTGTDAEKLGTLPTNVAWPAQSDYSRAMQNLAFSVAPKYTDIREAKVSPNPYVKLSGNIVYSSGNYGTIFKLVNNGSAHALKCFTRSKPDLNRRYLGISKTLHSTKGDHLAFVEFQYLPNAVRTFRNPAIYFPALRMPWIEGENLNQFITEHINDRKALTKLAEDFLYEMEKIRKMGISHGDISGDNIMVDSKGKITLVDYDGMYVPGFEGMKAAEIGHDHFQHPARDSTTYSERLDNFSILVTYLSILAVSQNPKLWDRYNGNDQDCLIFRKRDFQDPRNSMVFVDLEKIRGKVRTLSDLLVEALSHGPLWDGTDPSKIAKIKK